MNIEKLIEAFAEGDDEIEIHIKRTVDDDDECEEIFCNADCEECGDDFCPIDDDDDWKVISKNAKDVREELRDDVMKLRQKIVDEKGEAYANSILSLGKISSKITICMEEHIPIRVTDVLEYNNAVKEVFDEACNERYVGAHYVLIDHAIDKKAESIKD